MLTMSEMAILEISSAVSSYNTIKSFFSKTNPWGRVASRMS